MKSGKKRKDGRGNIHVGTTTGIVPPVGTIILKIISENFSPVLSTLLDCPCSPCLKSVYCPFSDVQSSTGVTISNNLVATILYWVWIARNRATFQNSLLSSSKIIGQIKNDVCMRIRGDRHGSVQNFWSFKNALCSVDIIDEITSFPLL